MKLTSTNREVIFQAIRDAHPDRNEIPHGFDGRMLLENNVSISTRKRGLYGWSSRGEHSVTVIIEYHPSGYRTQHLKLRRSLVIDKTVLDFDLDAFTNKLNVVRQHAQRTEAALHAAEVARQQAEAEADTAATKFINSLTKHQREVFEICGEHQVNSKGSSVNLRLEYVSEDLARKILSLL